MKKLLALLLVMILAFTALTACKKNKDDDDDNNQNNQQTTETNYAQTAINFVDTLYGNVDAKTGTSYDLVASYTVPGTNIVVAITWTTNSTVVTISPAADGKVTVNVPAAGDADVNYTITATATYDGKTATKTYNRVVPSVNNYMTPDQYYAAATGDAIIVKGIITGIINKTNGQQYNQIYVNDENNAGGYYVYGIKEESIDDLKVGMTVKVTGVKEKTSYNEQRIKDAVVDILDSSIKTVTPVDYTEIYKNAAALTDASLVGKAGMLVTLKGVEITGQTLDKGYYHFKLGTKESYVRISSSTCCLHGTDLNTFKTNHTNNKGNTADVVGVIATYDKAFYIVPVSVNAYSNFQTVTRTDAEKVQYELDGLTVTDAVKTDSEITLTTVGKMYNNVVITWTSNNACAVVSTDGTKVTFTLQDTEQTVTLTASATIGSATPVTKTFTVKVAAKANYVINKIEAPVAGTAYKLYLYHATQGQNLFLTGKMDGYNLAVTGDVNQSVDFYLETADGGYYLSATVDGVKRYVNLAVDGKYLDITTDMDPITVYRFDAATKTLLSTHTTSEGTSDFYFGTYSTSSKTGVTTSKTSFITGSNAANVGKTQFVVYLATITDLSAMSDADKVAAEKNNLTVDTTVNGDKKVDLPNATIAGVTVEWSVTDNATIADGKLVITQGTEAITVVLTATIKAGTATDTKDFTFEVPKKSTKVVQPVYTYEENTPYKLVGNNSFGLLYFNGTMTSKRINGVANLNDSCDIYVKYADKAAGTFYLYYYKNGSTTPTYIYAKGNETAGFYESNTVPETVWFVDANNNNAIVSVEDPSASTLKYRMISTQLASTYNNFSFYAISNANKPTEYFVCYLGIVVDENEVPEVTDADKVKAEADGVKFDVTNVDKDSKIDLPAPKTYTDVVFNWSVDNAAVAEIVDGKLVITLPAKSTTVTLTLEIVSGEAKDTKTFTIDVTVPVYTLNNVTAPAADTAYKFYLVQGKLGGKTLYFAGSVNSSGFIVSTENIAEAVDVYLEKTTDDGYFLYFYKADKTKTYIDMYVTGTSVRFKETTAPVCVYTYNPEFHGLYVSLKAGSYTNNYYFGTNGTYATFSPSSDHYFTGSNAGNLETTNFLCYFATISCTHEYTSECDTTCDVCGATREAAVEHKVDDECDADCNVCGDAVVPTHKFAYECATVCECEATREAAVDHKVDDECDATCNVCSEAVTPTHKYTSECDTTCGGCEATRETTVDHKYLGECDATCEKCDATRETTEAHSTKSCEEAECSVCGAAVEPKAHEYDGCEDTQCNNCEETRAAGEHAWSSVCDATCNNEGCNGTRDAASCTDIADNNGICDNVGCGKEVGPDTPPVDTAADSN